MQVDVSAGDQSTLQTANDAVLAALSRVQGLAELKTNLVTSKPQYQLVPTDKLAASGLNIQTLAALVAQAINGQVAAQAVLPQGTMIRPRPASTGNSRYGGHAVGAAHPNGTRCRTAFHAGDDSRGDRPADRDTRQR